MIRDPGVPTDKKRHEGENVARKESNFLRFLRTKESPSNFQTIKIIGKGAFGDCLLYTSDAADESVPV